MLYKGIRNYFKDWSLIEGNLRKKYPELKANDLAYTEGSEEDLLSKLQNQLGMDRETILSELETMLDEK